MRDFSSDNLIVYAPLTEAFRYPYKFFNYRSGSSFAATGPIDWLDSNLLICPSQTIFSYDQNTCLTEEFVKLSQDTSDIVHVMKGPND